VFVNTVGEKLPEIRVGLKGAIYAGDRPGASVEPLRVIAGAIFECRQVTLLAAKAEKPGFNAFRVPDCKPEFTFIRPFAMKCPVVIGPVKIR
jgi:hypothetical protein